MSTNDLPRLFEIELAGLLVRNGSGPVDVPDDRRVRRTRHALQEALWDLMQKKPYDSITVQNIIDRADVARATFYAHFRDKDALMLSELERVREAMRQHFSAALGVHRGRAAAKLHEDGAERVAYAVFALAAARRQEFRALVRSRSGGAVVKLAHQELTSLLREHLDEAVSRGGSAAVVPVEVTAQCVAGALMALLVWWLDRDPGYTAEDMSRMFSRLAAPAVSGSFGVSAPHAEVGEDGGD